jgi:glycosyltransferase involved in cell wall biosynthesis
MAHHKPRNNSQEENGMNILWLSAPASAETGYGRITKEVCSRLADLGHDVINVGGRGGTIIWGEKLWIHTDKGNRFLILPCWAQVGDRNTIEYYIKRYQREILITLWDCFVLPALGRPSIPWGAYFPIDSNFTRKWANYLINADLLITYSKFGYNEALKHYPDFMVKYIPHAVDVDLWHPRTEEEKIEIRRKWGIPEDKFMFLFVGANIGERKAPIQLMLTFKRFVKKHPNSLLYLYTNLASWPQGYDIIGFANELGIQNSIMMPAFNTILDSVEDEELAELYACADVTVNPTLGEGFGMAILESMSCGTPVIATNNSSMTELIHGRGWLVDTVPEDVWVDIPVWVPTLSRFNPPNLNSLLSCMEEAYNNSDLRKKYGRESREFVVKNYSWDLIMPMWEELIRELREARKF